MQALEAPRVTLYDPYAVPTRAPRPSDTFRQHVRATRRGPYRRCYAHALEALTPVAKARLLDDLWDSLWENCKKQVINSGTDNHA